MRGVSANFVICHVVITDTERVNTTRKNAAVRCVMLRRVVRFALPKHNTLVLIAEWISELRSTCAANAVRNMRKNVLQDCVKLSRLINERLK